MKKAGRRILIGLGILVVFISLVAYCSHRIDQNRAERKERDEKLEAGTCVFDTMNLDKLLIELGEISFYPVTDVTKLKATFSADFADFDVNDTSTQPFLYWIDNKEFVFYKRKGSALISSIKLDESSRFEFVSKDIVFSKNYEQDDFEKDFPKSFLCRVAYKRSNVQEVYSMRIDNSSRDTKLSFMILYFSVAERLIQVEFYYDRVNI